MFNNTVFGLSLPHSGNQTIIYMIDYMYEYTVLTFIKNIKINYLL